MEGMQEHTEHTRAILRLGLLTQKIGEYHSLPDLEGGSETPVALRNISRPRRAAEVEAWTRSWRAADARTDLPIMLVEFCAGFATAQRAA